MKILFLNYDKSNACSHYRSGGIAKDLAKQSGAKIDVMEFPKCEDMVLPVKKWDIIMLQRPCSEQALRICELAKENGVKVWSDYDDNILAVPKHNLYHEAYEALDRKRAIIGCLRLADVVTVSISGLQEVYSPYNSNIVVVPNATDMVRLPQNTEKIVAWRGGDSHIKDLQTFSSAINVNAMHHKDWLFEYMGTRPMNIPKFPNVKFTAPMSVNGYFAYLQQLQPTIMQVPLVDDAFNRGKSQIAAMEGTMVGAACLVPHWWDIPAVKYTDATDYIEKLGSMLRGDIDLQAYNDMAYEFVIDNWLLDDVNKIRCEIIKNI